MLYYYFCQVKYERDEKTAELDEVIEEYEEDLERRNVYLDELKSGYEELREQLAVARKERIDALMQYDELLKQNYHLNKKLETEVEENKKLRGEIIDYQQNLDSLQQQVDICKHDRDHALQLWNSSVEERKKLHHEMAMLIQARDTSLRKAFQQAEQLIRLREDRDRLQRELENLQRQKHLEPGSFHLDNPNRVSPVVSRNDSGYSADAEKLSNVGSVIIYRLFPFWPSLILMEHHQEYLIIFISISFHLMTSLNCNSYNPCGNQFKLDA